MVRRPLTCRNLLEVDIKGVASNLSAPNITYNQQKCPLSYVSMNINACLLEPYAEESFLLREFSTFELSWAFVYGFILR
ncbi:unnamed protein product, partial [Ceratitis capitata]